MGEIWDLVLAIHVVVDSVRVINEPDSTLLAVPFSVHG